MKISQLSPGQIVYDCHSYRMGNTTLRSLGVWKVRIVSVAEDGSHVMASWNHNPPTEYWAPQVAKWTAKEPDLVRDAFGGQRRKTRAEKAAEKSKGAA